MRLQPDEVVLEIGTDGVVESGPANDGVLRSLPAAVHSLFIINK